MAIDSQQLEVEPVDARIVAVKQCLREQYERMQKQLEALAEANAALTREKETLRKKVATSITSHYNIIPVRVANLHRHLRGFNSAKSTTTQWI